MKIFIKILSILGFWILITTMFYCGHGCSFIPPAGEFTLATNSPLPKWIDKNQLSQRDQIEFKYSIYDTVFTTKGRVTIEIRSPESNKLIKFNGVWESRPGEDNRHLHEGDVSLVRMTFKSVPEIYEFRHLKNIIVIKTNAVWPNHSSDGK